MSGLVKLVLSLLVALPAPAAGGGDSGDFLAGAAERRTRIGATLHIVVAAHSDSHGGDARGHFAVRTLMPDGRVFRISGEITCLRVVGNMAVAGGVVTQSNEPLAPDGSGYLIEVTDNGSPGAGRDTNINYLQATDIETCPFLGLAPEMPIEQGNFVVRDA